MAAIKTIEEKDKNAHTHSSIRLRERSSVDSKKTEM